MPNNRLSIGIPVGTALSLLWAGPVEAQVAPREPFVVEGACPFECCMYRDWIAERSFSGYTSEGDTTAVAFGIAEGETFAAVTGNVHITQIGVVELLGPLHQYGLDSGGRRFEPGDSLFVLDYLGEGFYNVWYDGEVLEATDYWWRPEDITPEIRDSVRAIQHREPESEWWVRIQRTNGSEGWILMREAQITGADACS